MEASPPTAKREPTDGQRDSEPIINRARTTPVVVHVPVVLPASVDARPQRPAYWHLSKRCGVSRPTEKRWILRMRTLEFPSFTAADG
jgi:hypothetical protein